MHTAYPMHIGHPLKVHGSYLQTQTSVFLLGQVVQSSMWEVWHESARKLVFRFSSPDLIPFLDNLCVHVPECMYMYYFSLDIPTGAPSSLHIPTVVVPSKNKSEDSSCNHFLTIIVQ